MEIVDVPKPKMNAAARIAFATEVAFSSLIDEAKKLGLELDPVMGLMYLPDQQLTRQFQTACRVVLTALLHEPTPKDKP